MPLVLFLIAAVCLPIWVSFHSGVLGNLTAWMTGTSGMLGGGIDYLWGAAILAVVVAITAIGGYSTLERIQLAIVAAMLLSAGVTLVLYNPDWLALLKGAVMPQPYVYPPWLGAEYPDIAATAGVGRDDALRGRHRRRRFRLPGIHLFHPRQGMGAGRPGPGFCQAAGRDRRRSDAIRFAAGSALRWSIARSAFLVIVAFSAVFVASGVLILGPHHKIPDEKESAQSPVRRSSPAYILGCCPLYVAGAFLTMLGNALWHRWKIACCIAWRNGAYC